MQINDKPFPIDKRVLEETNRILGDAVARFGKNAKITVRTVAVKDKASYDLVTKGEVDANSGIKFSEYLSMVYLQTATLGSLWLFMTPPEKIGIIVKPFRIKVELNAAGTTKAWG